MCHWQAATIAWQTPWIPHLFWPDPWYGAIKVGKVLAVHTLNQTQARQLATHTAVWHSTQPLNPLMMSHHAVPAPAAP